MPGFCRELITSASKERRALLIFEPLCAVSNAAPVLNDELTQCNTSLRAYSEGRFTHAATRLDEYDADTLSSAFAESPPCRRCATRTCKNCAKRRGWDGIHTFCEK
jgi:hypothetical protein